MINFALNDKTKSLINNYLSNPSQSLIVVNHSSSLIIEKLVANELVGNVRPDSIRIVEKSDDDKSIPIEMIRKLKADTSLKLASSKTISRVIIIKQAHLMNHEAQNALLKLIEEPNAGYAVILSTDNPLKLLGTVRSRCANIQILPISLGEALNNFSSHDKAKVSSAWHMADGQVELMSELLESNEHSLSQNLQRAKDYIKADKYTRFIMLDKLAKSREETILFFEALGKVTSFLYRNSPTSQNAKRLIDAAKFTNKAITMLKNNASPKLIALLSQDSLKI